MLYLRFLFSGFFVLALLGFLIKSLLIFWAPQMFASLSAGQLIQALVWGFRFDLAAAAMLSMPVAILTYALQRLGLIRHLSLRWFWLPAWAMLGMHLADMMYFDHAGRHLGYEIRELFPELGGLLGTALLQYAPFLIIFVFLGAAGWRLSRRSWQAPAPRWTRLEIPLLLWLAVGVLAIRGSVSDIPMKPDRAFAIGNELQALLALNPAYGILSSLFEKNVATPIYLTAPEPDPAFLQQQLDAYLQNRDGPHQPPVKRMNIVLMMLESWPAELVHSYNAASLRVTPELDALKGRGLSTDGLIAGGMRTTEGFFSALCSYQNPLGQGVPNTSLESHAYRCLPALLRDAGWHVAVFQGTHRGTTGQFSQRLGAESSFGKLDLPKPTIPKNSWGHQDPDLYRFVLEMAKQESRPFFYIINNASTHDAQLPPGESWEFGRETEEQRRMSVLHYADKALGEFLAAYETAGLGPTLFVITADHTAGGRSSTFGYFWIPFSMFATDDTVPNVYKPGIGSQRDIAPTIMDFLGGHAPWFSGRSLLSSPPGGGDYFANGIHGWVQDMNLIEYPMHSPNDLRCYTLNHGTEMQTARDCTRKDEHQRDFLRALTWYSQSLLFSGRTQAFGREQLR